MLKVAARLRRSASETGPEPETMVGGILRKESKLRLSVELQPEDRIENKTMSRAENLTESK